MDIHGISMDMYEYTTYIPRILVRTAYTWHIPGIYQAYTENRGSTCWRMTMRDGKAASTLLLLGVLPEAADTCHHFIGKDT
jgi:hypothetical protein